MDRIQHDYLDDLKRSHADLRRIDATKSSVPDATARLVRSEWHEDGKLYVDLVLFMIHANAVYILDARSDEDHLAETRSAFDAIRSSIAWR